MLTSNLTDELLQAFLDSPNQHLAAALRTPDEMVHHQMDVMPFVLIVHVYGIASSTAECKYPTSPAPNKERLSSPLGKTGAFKPVGCNLVDAVACELFEEGFGYYDCHHGFADYA